MTPKSLPCARAASHLLAALAILWLGAGNLLAGTLVGASRDVSGANYTGPVNRIQFKPLGIPQTIGTNVYWPFEVSSRITNNFFSAPLIQGFYWASPVVANPFIATPRTLIYMPDSDTNNIWQFNDCANIAAQLRTYVSSNAYVQMTNFPASAITNAPWINSNASNVDLAGNFSGTATLRTLIVTNGNFTVDSNGVVSLTYINIGTNSTDPLYIQAGNAGSGGTLPTAGGFTSIGLGGAASAGSTSTNGGTTYISNGGNSANSTKAGTGGTVLISNGGQASGTGTRTGGDGGNVKIANGGVGTLGNGGSGGYVELAIRSGNAGTNGLVKVGNLISLGTVAGNGAALTFTNDAGSSFRLIVNSTTNGFTFVPQ